MRTCQHCAHDSADHLSFCSACGRWLGAPTSGMSAFAGGLDARVRGTAAYSRTLVAAPRGAVTGPATVAITGRGPTTTGRTVAEPPKRGLSWAGDAIAYIYVYLRDKLDAGARRRRLTEERAGAEAMLSGAINDLAATVLREGVQHADFTGLLEAIGRAHARREAAAADVEAADTLQQNEATRLGAQVEAADAEWTSGDRTSRDADEILRGASADRDTAGARLGRVKDERARLSREMSTNGTDARAAQLAHDAVGLADEQRALEELTEKLDRQLADLRDNSATLRTAAAASKAKLDQATAARRDAASAMSASIAGRQRDRATAEKEAATLTEQLGRAAAEIRPPHGALLSAYQNIDRLSETIADRSAQIAAIEQMQAHYDLRKLLTGVGLLTSMIIATAAALWAVLR
jgi:predicted  nucleic acid-binding Zn-ribbon protein